MRPSLIILAALGASASARPSLKERGTAAIQAYTSWQLRLFSEAEPICNPDDANVNLSIWTRKARYGVVCNEFDPSWTEGGAVVKSLSFKTVDGDDAKDFCMFSSSTNCTAETLVDSITSGWEVCYPYNGWVGYSVVDHGAPCV